MKIIKNSEKYAAINLWRTRSNIQIGSKNHLGENIYICKEIPFEITDWWLEQLGQIQCERILESDLFIVTTEKSLELDVLNAENNRLIEKCRNVFYSFILSGPICTESTPKLLTGSKRGDTTSFRSIGDFEHPKFIMGTKNTIIDSDRIKNTFLLYIGLNRILNQSKIRGRVMWALNCFLNGLTGNHIYERIRNYIRTIEAFILPKTGETKRNFKSRTELFIGPKHHDFIDNLYDIRSAIEHLHDPLNIINGKSKADKFTQLLKYGLIAEYIARYCITRFLVKEDIWEHFQDDIRIQQFWSMEISQKKEIWGSEFNIVEVDNCFDPRLVKYVDI